MQAAIDLALAFLGARALGWAAERLEQPAVLGELLAGVLLVFLPFFRPSDPFLLWAARAGVALLLFETGLDSDAGRLLGRAHHALAVAVTGVAFPLLLGWAVMRAAGASNAAAVFVGGALTATSVGITVRVLKDLGRMQSHEAQVVLGAAVIDDVLGLLVLSAVAGVADAEASGFVVASFVFGLLLSARPSPGMRRALKPFNAVLVPVFFAACGAGVRLPALTGSTWALAAALLVAAVAGKALCGWAAREEGLNRWAIGAAMIPRGEVGLVFAQIGLASGTLDASAYAAVVAVVAATTFLAPPLIRRAFSHTG